MDKSGLRAFVVGATGSCGRELVKELIKSSKWSQVTVLVRKPLSDWDSFTSEEKKRLNIVVREDLEGLSDYSKWNLTGYSSVFCCLGALATEVSSAEYIKVNSTYPENAAKLAAHFNVPHYSLVSGEGIHSKSWNSGMRARGEMEDRLLELKFPLLSILKPGVITGRGKGERFFEKVFSYLPFFPQISAQQVGLGQRIDAELQHTTPYKSQPIVYSNAQILELIKTGIYPQKD